VLAGLPQALGRPVLGAGAAGSGAGAEAPDPPVADESDDSGGLPLAVSFLILALLLIAAVVLVRRMVLSVLERRQMAQSSAFPDAQRRGWLHVVERGDLQEPKPHVRPLRGARRR
jgi:hypothetical protein